MKTKSGFVSRRFVVATQALSKGDVIFTNLAMAALAEFERDLRRERVRSGITAARKRGVIFGRRPGQRVKVDRFTPKVLAA